MYKMEMEEQDGKKMESDRIRGLSVQEAAERLKKHGANKLKERKKKSVAALFLEQLNDPLIYILMAAIAVSLFLGEVGESMIIAVVIILNAMVGVIQEGKAIKAIEALQDLSSPHAIVRRDGKEMEILSREVVPGDVILLEAGRQVPADAELICAYNLKVDESALTGESVPVEKDCEAARVQGGGIGDRHREVFMATMVTSGRGEAAVTATGMNTEIGKIAGMLEDTGEEMTPLQRRLADLGKILSGLAIGICLFLFLVAVIQKRNIADMLLTAISLAVAAVPEGLAAVVTIVLALSVSRMVKVGAIVRKLPSVETLGAVNVVCSDKTGTLTQNKMTVKECYVNGKLVESDMLDADNRDRLLQACVLCNDAKLGEQNMGDPTELALLFLAKQYGICKEEQEGIYPRIQERAFDSTRKRMTTIHEASDGKRSFTKGAADRILPDCKSIWKNGKEAPFSERAKREVCEAGTAMASKALRVLALAMKTKGDLESESDMIFLGLVGMIDPPRKEVKEAVESFRRAHVDTVMITGDHADTALAIARELGIADRESQCMRGEELEELDDETLSERIEEIKVFARVSPEHKVRIVHALKRKEKIVAMTGDGINDAPSLRAADVGIAMGQGGTDVARNAADLVLTDDHFATIEKAIREGRGIYENIRKTILFLLSSNFGEILTMLTAILAGFPATLKASHILWVNLITDSLPALALGMDTNDGDELMKLSPRKSTDTMFSNGGLSCTICYGIVIGVISLVAFLTVPYGELLNKNLPVTLHNLKKILEVEWVLNKAQTHAFTVLGMSQLVHAVGMKDVNRSVFRMKHLNNRYMIAALGIGFLLQFLVTEIPYFVTLFGTSRLSVHEWLMLGLLAFVPLFVHELLCLFSTAEERQAEAEE